MTFPLAYRFYSKMKYFHCCLEILQFFTIFTLCAVMKFLWKWRNIVCTLLVSTILMCVCCFICTCACGWTASLEINVRQNKTWLDSYNPSHTIFTIHLISSTLFPDFICSCVSASYTTQCWTHTHTPNNGRQIEFSRV